MATSSFDWDSRKDLANQAEHGVPFLLAQHAFGDPLRVVAEDTAHSAKERRYFCFGRVRDEIMTVRFTYRAKVIRIIGAGYWRKGRTIYERENQIHR